MCAKGPVNVSNTGGDHEAIEYWDDRMCPSFPGVFIFVLCWIRLYGGYWCCSPPSGIVPDATETSVQMFRLW